ncbi:MAG: hypothetical protein HY315_07670 [Acidobacteria bacterium]|nr:hypothetical protein [Acidobacteriota bacterium]
MAETTWPEATRQQDLESQIRQGGGWKNIEKQHQKGRLTARERIEKLLDPGSFFFEIGLWAAFDRYAEWGGAPAGGIVCGVGRVAEARHMIIANDATVKAGAFFPMTVKKLLRAQHMAMAARLPLIYLVDSAGVFLPLQDEVFPDEDDFGRIFRNNAVISAAGIPQTAAIMGSCVAGGAYLPVMCDRILMTEGSGLYIAGPSLVKAAIGKEIGDEDLGGARLHSTLSGTVDFREKDDLDCLARVRALAADSFRPAAAVLPNEELEEFHPIAEGELYCQRRLRVGSLPADFVLLRPGFSAQFDPVKARAFLDSARHRREVVVVLCQLGSLAFNDAAALADFAFECCQAGPQVLLVQSSWQDLMLRHGSRSLAPAMVLSPFGEESALAAARLWTDLLYPADSFLQILEEALSILGENTGQ